MDIKREATGYIVGTIRHNMGRDWLYSWLLDITREGTGYIVGTIRHNTGREWSYCSHY